MSQDFVIVLQGPVAANTEQIIRFYSETYDCQLILSTYTNSVNFDPKLYPKLRITTIDQPRSGWGNRNVQRHSSFHGIKLAKELGFKYCLKNRTDHFFKHPDLIQIFKRNLETFPLYNQTGQSERIILPNGGTTLNYLCGGVGGVGGKFHLSDHWWMGRTEDLYNYCDLNNPHWDSTKDFQFNPITATEVEFCRLWMMRQGIEYPTVSSLLRDKFIVLDNQALYYDQVKNPVGDIRDVRTDWVGWCDPLTIHSRIWYQFMMGKTYDQHQELELNKHQRLVF